MKKLIIELPFPLPLWNQLLGMNPWRRMRVRHLLHQFVSQLQVIESGSTTRMVSALKPCSMELWLAEYLAVIRANTSSKSASRAIQADEERTIIEIEEIEP